MTPEELATLREFSARMTVAMEKMATAMEQLTLSLMDALSKTNDHVADLLEDGLPMGDEEPPLPVAPPYVSVPGQFPPITGPVIDAPPQPQAQVVSPIPPMPQGVCPEHRQPWSKFVPAGVSRNGRPYAAFWACPATGCKQRSPR